MKTAAYLEMAETNSRHWWFSSRRAILSRMIESLDLPQNSKILEVVYGTGGNLQMLAKFKEISTLEIDANTRAMASKKTNNLYEIRAGYCLSEIPFHDQRFDLVCMFDVLEHVDQDTEILIAIKQLLAKNGLILITVPAYQWLWGVHDESIHHKRRYSATQLRKKVVAAELQPVKISYFNTILFPLAASVRLKDKLLRSPSATGTSVPPTPINKLFRTLFGAEGVLLERFNLPFGVSLLCILKADDEFKTLPPVFIRKALRFALLGLLVTGLHVLVATAFIQIVLPIQSLANGVAFAVANMFSYWIHTTWSFSSQLHGRNLFRFFCVSFIGLFLTMAVSGAAQYYGLHYWYGIGFVVCIVPPVTFLIHNFWTYK
jgi:SAM-dependent methyltransferase/putative flippase GtrA